MDLAYGWIGAYRSQRLDKLSVVDCTGVVSVEYVEYGVQLSLVGGELGLQHSRDEIVSADRPVLYEKYAKLYRGARGIKNEESVLLRYPYIGKTIIVTTSVPRE